MTTMNKKATEKKMEAKNTTKAKGSAGVPKNFRQQADIESFYRFVYENDLRNEAVQIFRETRAQKVALKVAKNRLKH